MAELNSSKNVYEEPEWYLLRSLWRLEVELGRSPTKDDFPRNDTPELSEYYAAFGKLRFARTAAGLATDRKQGVEAQRANLLFDLRELGIELQRVPSAGDINDAASRNQCRYVGAYLAAFGSLKEAQNLAGFCPNESKTKLSKGVIVDRLIEFYEGTSRFPGARELAELSKKKQTPSFSAICRAFGSYEDAKKAALAVINLREDIRFKPGRSQEQADLLEAVYKLALEGSESAKTRLVSFFSVFVNLMSRARGIELSTQVLLDLELQNPKNTLSEFTHSFHMLVLEACDLTPSKK